MEQYKKELMRKESATRNAAFMAFRRLIAERQLVDRRQAANLLGVTLRTLRRWHEDSQGPPRVSFGARKVYYAMPDIVEQLKKKERRRNKRLRKKGATSNATHLQPLTQEGLLPQ